ncbi:hypothetical protein NIES4071_69570 [Calothrix sp. NIES-4071]|nr:hypothetical protein NIES4071_69570 [Calothrix sp. NIES-4071]BAZ61234.1 hypothetical protein NIES4105_69520 [Calothrix sp. NIES-4105]
MNIETEIITKLKSLPIDKQMQLLDFAEFLEQKNILVQKKKEQLKQQLKEGAIRRAERDLKVAQDWFALEEEACQPSAEQ